MQVRPRDLSSEAIDLRLMTESDLAAADELRKVVGWNQTPQDWRRLLTVEPNGCFVALHNGVLAGTVTISRYGTELAWIGMMLVHPAHRRMGVATRLMNRALDYLKERQVRCVKLDATAAGQPLYEQLGFVSEWSLQRWERTRNEQPAGQEVIAPQTRTLSEEDWPVVEEIDMAAFGVRRPELLRRLAQESRHALVWPARGRVLAFGLLRPGANSDYLGPLMCVGAEGSVSLITDLVSAARAHAVTWDIPDHNALAKALARRFGFRPVRPLTRMRLGPRTDPPQPDALFGIADPAVG